VHAACFATGYYSIPRINVTLRTYIVRVYSTFANKAIHLRTLFNTHIPVRDDMYTRESETAMIIIL
jgi:hypothetical protein